MKWLPPYKDMGPEAEEYPSWETVTTSAENQTLAIQSTAQHNTNSAVPAPSFFRVN
jgi:hypothetical protein